MVDPPPHEGGDDGQLSPSDYSVGPNVVVAAASLNGLGPDCAIGLDEANHHHLARVLRIRPNESLTLTDGWGQWIEAVVASNFSTSGVVTTTGRLRQTAEPPDVGVAFALTKSDKPETVVQKLTELGIRRIVPIRASRSIVKWDANRADHHIARLEAVARSALAQCGGAWLPVIEPVTDVAVLALRGGVVRADRGGRAVSSADRLIAVGPEGGWNAEERELLVDVVGLPGAVLRAETAAIVAAALLVAGVSRRP